MVEKFLAYFYTSKEIKKMYHINEINGDIYVDLSRYTSKEVQEKNLGLSYLSTMINDFGGNIITVEKDLNGNLRVGDWFVAEWIFKKLPREEYPEYYV